MKIKPHQSGYWCTFRGWVDIGTRCLDWGKQTFDLSRSSRGWVRAEVLLNKCKWELDYTSQEVSEVLVEHKGLDPWEGSERESFKHLFEPYLIACSAINLSHIDIIIITIKTTFYFYNTVAFTSSHAATQDFSIFISREKQSPKQHFS
jgi:hypothetical protein